MKIGIIAEDDSDVAVLREITLALLKPHRIGFKHFVGDGSGKLRRKCGAWARNLMAGRINGASALVDEGLVARGAVDALRRDTSTGASFALWALGSLDRWCEVNL